MLGCGGYNFKHCKEFSEMPEFCGGEYSFYDDCSVRACSNKPPVITIIQSCSVSYHMQQTAASLAAYIILQAPAVVSNYHSRIMKSLQRQNILTNARFS